MEEENRFYSEQMDDLDASVFSGELLFTNLDEFEYYVKRWQRAIDKQREIRDGD